MKKLEMRDFTNADRVSFQGAVDFKEVNKMKNGITINGQTIELSEHQVKVLKQALEVNTPKKLKKEPVNPFKKAEVGKPYYYIGGYGKVYSDDQLSEEELCAIDYDGGTDSELLFKNANYCQDENIMKQRSMHEILNRRLWRYAMENEYIATTETTFYCIVPNVTAEEAKYSATTEMLHSDERAYGGIYFIAEGCAEKAIEYIIVPFLREHPDFKW